MRRYSITNRISRNRHFAPQSLLAPVSLSFICSQLTGMFAWVVRLWCKPALKEYVFEPSRPVQFLQTGNALSAKKPHATTPFRTTGLATQSRGNKLSIGRPNLLTLPSILQRQAPLFTEPCMSVNRLALSQRSLGRPL